MCNTQRTSWNMIKYEERETVRKSFSVLTRSTPATSDSPGTDFTFNDVKSASITLERSPLNLTRKRVINYIEIGGRGRLFSLRWQQLGSSSKKEFTDEVLSFVNETMCFSRSAPLPTSIRLYVRRPQRRAVISAFLRCSKRERERERGERERGESPLRGLE